MKIGVLKETRESERRIPITPESLKRLTQKKLHLVLESGAGEGSSAADADYVGMGGELAPTAADVLAQADAVVRLSVPSVEDVARLREGTTLIAPIFPLLNSSLVQALAARNITAFAVDAIPRTTVAQMMDVLSSQATCAGYYAVVLAASKLPRFFPMLITAAGTIAPATVLVLGAGVAGLSAIGVARRLGARVEAFDVRKVAKEQVESLGAKFVEVESTETADGAGGYAKETSDDYKAKQAMVLAKYAAKADVIICTALIPGKRAPLLVTEEMIRSMRPGSVIVDLAAEQHGNAALTEPGKTVTRHGVTIVGELDMPSHLAMHASQMYSRNMEKLLFHLTKDGAFVFDMKEEITAGCLITRGGDVMHRATRQALGLPPLGEAT